MIEFPLEEHGAGFEKDDKLDQTVPSSSTDAMTPSRLDALKVDRCPIGV